jgi:hypothetical protein
MATAEMEPAHPLVRIWVCRALLALGRYDEALQAVETSAGVGALDGYVGCLRAAALVGLGRKEVVLNDPSSPWTYMVDVRGRADHSLAALERCWDERIGHLPWLVADPLCDPLRRHPRFTALVERMGLAIVATPRPFPIAISSRNRPGLKVV